jgi:NAD-dependent deacetylase
MQEELVRRAGEVIAAAERLVVFTGAGVSRESGLPTFRDAQEGLWARYDPQELASVEGFRRNPELVWEWYRYRRDLCRAAQPNPGHRAIAELEELVPHVVVITQNIDDLHRRAGSSDIIELHGNIFRYKCLDADHPVDPEVAERADRVPPRCPTCGGLVRPDVVWFGEYLPGGAFERALEESRRCDVMLVVGTSGVVQPAALLPYEAAGHGATVIEVNPRPSELTHLADIFLQAPSGEVLPKVVESVRRAKGM